jgi:FAD/FMN-containing dehydrogenase
MTGNGTVSCEAGPEELRSFIEQLKGLLGKDNVLTDSESLEFYSFDFSEQRLEKAAAVARPGSQKDVVDIVKLAYALGFPVVPRGGGMSYTLAYMPKRKNSLLLDMTRMNRILKIDTDNLYIVVEPGVTWEQIYEATRDMQYGLSFFGTMSGRKATVGGGLGNNAVGHGPGEIVDNLLGIEVVLPDGRVIQTGALATRPEGPSIRNYGPDFTGVFVNDAGALGVKTKAVFRLKRKAYASAYGAFGFGSERETAMAACEVVRLGIATNIYGFGSYHHEVFMNQPAPCRKEALELLRAVYKNASGPWRGVRDILCIARPGGMKRFKKWGGSLHVIVDGCSQRAVDSGMAKVKRLLRKLGGHSLPPILSIVVRAQPFVPIDTLIVGLDGKNCFPSSCVVPIGRLPGVWDAVEEFFARNADLMNQHNIRFSRTYIVVNDQFGLEPIIYWKDAFSPLRRSILSPENEKKYGDMPPQPEARKAAIDLRHRLVEVLQRVKGAHIQIGKFYPYRDALVSGDSWSLLEDFKNTVDAKRLMNPGALGLE